MINQKDRDTIKLEIRKMRVRSKIAGVIYYWEDAKLCFMVPYLPSHCTVPISGDTTDEIIEAIRLDVNQILQDMIDTLEASKLLYKFGKGGVTV